MLSRALFVQRLLQRYEFGKKEPSLHSSKYFLGSNENPVDSDGWLHSGDIGQWNANGTLTVIDRRKNIFKLAQGEYVAPERVEGVYAMSQFVSQIFVTGNSLEGARKERKKVCMFIRFFFLASLVAIVVPNEENGMAFARANGLRADNLQQLCKDHTFKVFVLCLFFSFLFQNPLFFFFLGSSVFRLASASCQGWIERSEKKEDDCCFAETEKDSNVFWTFFSRPMNFLCKMEFSHRR